MAMLQRVDANDGGDPMTTVVATVSSVCRVIARSTMIEPCVSVENTAPCLPGRHTDVVGDQRDDVAGGEP